MNDTSPTGTTRENKTQKGSFTPGEIVCKVIADSPVLPTSSKQWTRAKKCKLVIDHDGLHFQENFIGLESLKKCTMHIYKSALFFEYGVLAVETDDATYHFGVKYDDFWKGDLPFPMERARQETPFILFRQILIIVILVYIFWEVVKN